MSLRPARPASFITLCHQTAFVKYPPKLNLLQSLSPRRHKSHLRTMNLNANPTPDALGDGGDGNGLKSPNAFAKSAAAKDYTPANTAPPSNPSAPRLTLYPFIAPYDDALLRVSTLHLVHYELSGNPNGIPVCFVHGGPGGGTEPAHRQFFDPQLYKIVLIDQRGCGASLPFASLEENTTWDLINDMDAVRRAAGIDKWILFGGSWGSTLALAYAQEHPDRVLGMILRGIFLSRDQELRWLYERDGIAMLYPEAFNRYVAGLPPRLRNSESLMKAYHSILSKEENTEERQVAANAWSLWEYTLSSFPRIEKDSSTCHVIYNTPSNRDDQQQRHRHGTAQSNDVNNNHQQTLTSSLDFNPDVLDYTDNDNLAFARIESHFFVNGCFFDSDGMLLNEQRMARVRHIKTRIVQGRWDFVCPRKTAFDLANMFDHSAVETHIIDNAGHSTFEPGIEEALLRATADFAREFAHHAGQSQAGGEQKKTD